MLFEKLFLLYKDEKVLYNINIFMMLLFLSSVYAFWPITLRLCESCNGY